MTQLRKHYFLDRWTIIAPQRRKRPVEFKKEKAATKKCAFCAGNESLTPPEIGRTGGRRWKMRWFPNKFPVVTPEGSAKISGGKLAHGDAYGYHEVIVETPSPAKQLWDLPKADVARLLEIYRERINDIGRRKRVKYVLVAKNHGLKAGASFTHSHTQVASFSMVPPAVRQEINRSGSGCKFCPVIKSEKKSPRKCLENDSVIAFAPYASRFAYELWIAPKRHLRKLSDMSEKELKDFAEILSKALKKVKKLNRDYNYYLHYAPGKSDLHLHLELITRAEYLAGIEFGSEIAINLVPPEEAAEFYRK